MAEDVSSKTLKLAKQLEKEMIEAVKNLNLRKQLFYVIKSHFWGEEVKKSFKVNR